MNKTKISTEEELFKRLYLLEDHLARTRRYIQSLIDKKVKLRDNKTNKGTK